MKIEKAGAHLDQMLRQTRIHHVQLSAMADNKANMLITVSSITITLAIGFLRDERLLWVAATVIGFCALTIFLAAYAAMPKLPGPAVRRDTQSKGFNLLFFGDFSQMTYEEYVEAMEYTLSDPDRCYEAMVREVYVMGQYLARRKYRFLSWAYLSFLGGITGGAIAWIVTNVIR